MKTNTRRQPPKKYTHGGCRAANISAVAELRRSVYGCFLWEDSFYEGGIYIGKRISDLVSQINDPKDAAAIAYEARNTHHLRHVPLLIVCAMAERGDCGDIVRKLLPGVIQRLDEVTELVAIWWKDGKRPLPASFKRGLAKALENFSEYQFKKYGSKKSEVTLRDVFRLIHPKPKSGMAATYQAVAKGTLEPADTWEVALSRGDDKCETFSRLLRENGLGYLALLRNLRNMVNAGVSVPLIADALRARRGAEKVLPFRYVSAARACPQLEPLIDEALCASIGEQSPLPGKTIVLVDVSHSMDAPLSGRSDMTRVDAACALASVINAEDLRVFSFSDKVIEVPPRRGMAGVDAVSKSQPHQWTHLASALAEINKIPHDRLIVITDEQCTQEAIPHPIAQLAYMINVGTYQNGVGYRNGWTHIDGFSDGVIRFIHASEGRDANATSAGPGRGREAADGTPQGQDPGVLDAEPGAKPSWPPREG
jgi:hypothetical protein